MEECKRWADSCENWVTLVYLYHFARRASGGRRLGSVSLSGTLVYVRNLRSLLGDRWERRISVLSEQMVTYWTEDFMKTGDPGMRRRGERWEAYTRENPVVKRF